MYDEPLKQHIDSTASDWVRWLRKRFDLPEGPYSVESPNLTTYKADADRVFRFDGPEPFLVNLELEAFWQAGRPARYLKYSVLLSDKSGLPVATVVMLLGPKADSSDLTGLFDRKLPKGRYLEWQYDVIRIWEIPPAEFLSSGLGLLPFAPLAAEESQLPEIVREIGKQLTEQAPAIERDVFAVTKVLMGLRFSANLIHDVMRGVAKMEESVIYKEILQIGRDEGLHDGIEKGRVEGRVEANRDSVVLLATDRFGPPSDMQRAQLEKVDDAGRLLRMMRKVMHSNSWDEILKTA